MWTRVAEDDAEAGQSVESASAALNSRCFAEIRSRCLVFPKGSSADYAEVGLNGPSSYGRSVLSSIGVK